MLIAVNIQHRTFRPVSLHQLYMYMCSSATESVTEVHTVRGERIIIRINKCTYMYTMCTYIQKIMNCT